MEAPFFLSHTLFSVSGLTAPLPVPPLANWDDCITLLTTDSIYQDMLDQIETDKDATTNKEMNIVDSQSVGTSAAPSPSVTMDNPTTALTPIDSTGSYPSPALISMLTSASASSRLSSLLQSASNRVVTVNSSPMLSNVPSQSLADFATPSPSPSSYPLSSSPPTGSSSSSSSSLSSSPTPISSTPPTVNLSARGGSRMTPEQVQANLEKAEKKRIQNAELKGQMQHADKRSAEFVFFIRIVSYIFLLPFFPFSSAKQSHYMDRFTVSFPAPKPISTTMQKAKSIEGPMALLKNFFTRKVRAHLSIRSSHAIHSIMSGYIIGFDKHFNIILFDVVEEYFDWEYHRYGAGTCDKLRREGKRWFIPKKSQRQIDESNQLTVDGSSHANPHTHSPILIRVEVRKQRSLHQLYVRGDSVVAVSDLKPTLVPKEMEGIQS